MGLRTIPNLYSTMNRPRARHNGLEMIRRQFLVADNIPKMKCIIFSTMTRKTEPLVIRLKVSCFLFCRVHRAELNTHIVPIHDHKSTNSTEEACERCVNLTARLLVMTRFSSISPIISCFDTKLLLVFHHASFLQYHQG
jgi:hypothetical protein